LKLLSKKARGFLYYLEASISLATCLSGEKRRDEVLDLIQRACFEALGLIDFAGRRIEDLTMRESSEGACTIQLLCRMGGRGRVMVVS